MNTVDDLEIEKIISEFAFWVKRERTKLKISQMEFSLKAGLSQNHIYAI